MKTKGPWTGVNKQKMTLAKYLFKKYQKACNLKFPPFHKNEMKKKTKKPQTEPPVSVSRKQ